MNAEALSQLPTDERGAEEVDQWEQIETPDFSLNRETPGQETTPSVSKDGRTDSKWTAWQDESPTL